MKTIRTWATARLLASLPSVSGALREQMTRELRARGILGAVVLEHLQRRRVGV